MEPKVTFEFGFGLMIDEVEIKVNNEVVATIMSDNQSLLEYLGKLIVKELPLNIEGDNWSGFKIK